MHQNGVACRHTAFDEVLVSLVTHFIKTMFFGQAEKQAVFFGYKAPGLHRAVNPPEQLNADAIHLGGVSQGPFLDTLLLEFDGSCMQRIMTGFAESQQIAFLITSLLTAKNEVMDFEALILRKTNFTQMSLKLASHCGRKTILFDGIFAVEPSCRTIPRLALATVTPPGCSLFHRRGDIVTQFHFGQVENVPFFVSRRSTHDGTARIHSQGDGLGIGGFRWSHQLDGKRRSPYHFGLLLFKQETGDRCGTGHQRSSL
jgi:hypothetical protein